MYGNNITSFHTPYFLVHKWLREHRFVFLAVSEPSIADQVQDHILLKFAPELDGDLRHVRDSLRIIAVYM